jgi:hypothetical protein
LKGSLKVPLAGMGIAFGCSLFGLSSSLILGFLNLNLRGVAEDFVGKIEEWATKFTVSFDVVDNLQEYHGEVFSMGLLEKTIETLYAFQKQLTDLEGNRVTIMGLQSELSKKLSTLSDSIVSHQDTVKALVKNQVELQNITTSIVKRDSDCVWKEMLKKLDEIEIGVKNLVQGAFVNREYIVENLGKDIRMVSKTLSSLMRN